MSINLELINNIGVVMYARNHHQQTREWMTEEEFAAEFVRLTDKGSVNTWTNEMKELYLDDFLNLQHELDRRAQITAKNINQFTSIIDDFNPQNIHRRTYSFQANESIDIFQVMADTFEKQRNRILNMEKTFGNRFFNEDEFENAHRVLHNQFNEAFKSIAEIVRSAAVTFGFDAQQAEDDILAIGARMLYHLSSGNGTSELMGFLRSDPAVVSDFDDLLSLTRRMEPGSVNDNPFADIMFGFNPSRTRNSEFKGENGTSIFQAMADRLQSMLIAENMNQNIQEQFNDAFRNIAEIMKRSARGFGIDTQSIGNDMLAISAMIFEHVSSGNNTNDIASFLEENAGTSLSFSELLSLSRGLNPNA